MTTTPGYHLLLTNASTFVPISALLSASLYDTWFVSSVSVLISVEVSDTSISSLEDSSLSGFVPRPRFFAGVGSESDSVKIPAIGLVLVLVAEPSESDSEEKAFARLAGTISSSSISKDETAVDLRFVVRASDSAASDEFRDVRGVGFVGLGLVVVTFGSGLDLDSLLGFCVEVTLGVEVTVGDLMGARDLEALAAFLAGGGDGGALLAAAFLAAASLAAFS